MLWNRDESRRVVSALSGVRRSVMLRPGFLRSVDVDVFVL